VGADGVVSSPAPALCIAGDECVSNSDALPVTLPGKGEPAEFAACVECGDWPEVAPPALVSRFIRLPASEPTVPGPNEAIASAPSDFLAVRVEDGMIGLGRAAGETAVADAAVAHAAASGDICKREREPGDTWARPEAAQPEAASRLACLLRTGWCAVVELNGCVLFGALAPLLASARPPERIGDFNAGLAFRGKDLAGAVVTAPAVFPAAASGLKLLTSVSVAARFSDPSVAEGESAPETSAANCARQAESAGSVPPFTDGNAIAVGPPGWLFP